MEDRPKANVVNIDFSQKKSSIQDDGPVTDELSAKKLELFKKWIARGTVCVLFDARSPEVKVPQNFKNRGELRLNFCYGFHIPDFSFDERGVCATLSFDDGEFFCSVPWAAMYGAQSAVLGEGAVWFESFPSDLDQVAVLGFSEDMCDELPSTDYEAESSANPDTDNVVSLAGFSESETHK